MSYFWRNLGKGCDELIYYTYIPHSPDYPYLYYPPYYNNRTTYPINPYHNAYSYYNYHASPYPYLENAESHEDTRIIAEIVAIAGGAAAVSEAISKVKSALSIINPPRSVILIFENHTNTTLRKVRENFEHGGWAVPPEGEIPPNSALIFGARSSAGSIATGTEGRITYAGDGIEVTLYWDNPFIGSNECNITISGPKAAQYRVHHACGAGDTDAQMRYELYSEVPTPTPAAKRPSANNSKNISAVSRIPNSMEIWWVGANGSVQDAFWYEGQPWRRQETAPAGSASTTGSITAVSRIPGSMEIWWIGANGSVQSAFWYEGQPWRRQETAPAGSASTTGGITAVSRIPGSMEVWWIGANGSVQSAFWYEGQPWRRQETAPAGSASTTGGITAVSRIPNSMEVWWIGANGSVQSAFWYEGQPWRRQETAPAGSASTTGGITAVSRIP
ncbi:hypothetical protein V7057_24860, partial [Bacillus pseudomycoides]